MEKKSIKKYIYIYSLPLLKKQKQKANMLIDTINKTYSLTLYGFDKKGSVVYIQHKTQINEEREWKDIFIIYYKHSQQC